ncbi:hypothetical protein IVA80_22645 [Bradyrhizobium sp. 139]|uniref:hypothetical protein n=1 Tax=Bradyrhizobium sp. 139 TaxID=2782616 RepID=UPI001FFA4CEC|nr:hypothetical protein [Bradyrhizobium sp. 139]MCK1743568.1 hypothetical protein [Bradyrhizobium sp. 139]
MKISSYSGKLNRGLLAFLVAHAVVCCMSLTFVVQLYGYLGIFELDRSAIIRAALLVVLPVALSVVFAYRHFSFGYLASFYVYTIVLGYLWLIPFSRLDYDHTLTGLSALASLVGFLAPSLLTNWSTKPQISVSPGTLNRLLIAILATAVATLVAGTYYNFKLVGVAEIYRFRDQLDFPAPLRYAIGITLGALLPFAFACFVETRARIPAFAILLLILCFYPITLTKTTLFAPAWLTFLWLLSSYVQPRLTVILSLLAPVLLGVILALLVSTGTISQAQLIDYFGSVNFRMIAFPSISLDVYNDFFSQHAATHFCQISLVASYIGCPYSEQLGVILARNYPVGNMNASLLATEGIASVGSAFAPVSALLSGFILSIGNYTSKSLPARFIILSSGLLIQTLLNVPLSVLMVTNGAAVTFLLWYITPCLPLSQRRGEA